MVFAIHWHESAMGVHVSPSWTPLPPPSPSHPSGSSQCTSPECPVSCIEPGLAIYFTYGNIHVSTLFSLFWLSARCMTEILKQCIPFKFSISWCFCVAFRVVFSGLSSNSLVSSLMIMYVCAKLLQTCLTLCDPMNCSPPGSSVCGISQARILEWVAISSCKGSSRPRDWTCVSNVSCIGRQVLYH